MVDVHTRVQRSYNMSRIKGKDTKPEVQLRKLLFVRNIRGYRLCYKLIGKPDIVYPRYKLAIFIDGCFWHKCPKCFQQPATNKEFWDTKLNGNIKRDRKVNRILRSDGWTVIRFWEHQIKKDINTCINRIIKMLSSRGWTDVSKNT